MGVAFKLLIQRRFALTRAVSVFKRQIMTSQSLRAEANKAAEELKSNPYYEKYAQKIAVLQQTSPEEFISRVEAREKEKSKPKLGATDNRQYSSLLEPKKQLTSTAQSQAASLNNIMKIDLIQDKEASEISKIWSEYHMKKDIISATIPAKMFEEISVNAEKYPTFLFPIPRSQGYEFIVSQFFKNTVHFTPLLHYQVHKENAPECLTITHYTEFKDSKGIVLMKGEFDKNVINAQEAQCLANQLQLYYIRNDSKKTELLEQFTKRPQEFKHMELIKQIETLSL